MGATLSGCIARDGTLDECTAGAEARGWHGAATFVASAVAVAGLPATSWVSCLLAREGERPEPWRLDRWLDRNPRAAIRSAIVERAVVTVCSSMLVRCSSAKKDVAAPASAPLGNVSPVRSG